MVRKKGQGLSFTMIIIASLGVLVLIIVGFIFKESILTYTKGYKTTADSALNQADGTACKSLFDTNRKCADTPPTPANGRTWEKVTGTFSDCGDKDCYQSSPIVITESAKDGAKKK